MRTFPPAVELEGVTVRFGDVTALRDVDLSVEEGECLVLLGPNGSGKTTLLRVVAGELRPSEGEVRVFGERPSRKLAGRVGYVPQERLHYGYLTALENLRFFATMYDVPKKRARELAERFDLPDRRADRLSGGYRRRLDLAIALLPDPDLLILDEPTEGLDVESRRGFWELLEELKEEGRTLLIATHDMEEAELLADRIAVIYEGKVIAVGTPEELRREVGGEPVIVVEGAIRGEEELPFTAVRRDDELRIHVEDPDRDLVKVVETLQGAGSRIEAVRVEEPSLEDVFVKLTGVEPA